MQKILRAFFARKIYAQKKRAINKIGDCAKMKKKLISRNTENQLFTPEVKFPHAKHLENRKFSLFGKMDWKFR